MFRTCNADLCTEVGTGSPGHRRAVYASYICGCGAQNDRPWWSNQSTIVNNSQAHRRPLIGDSVEPSAGKPCQNALLDGANTKTLLG